MKKAMTARDYQDQLLIEQGIERGIEQGIEQGELNMALKFVDELGIDEAVRISGFSRSVLKNKRLNK